MITVEPVDILL